MQKWSIVMAVAVLATIAAAPALADDRMDRGEVLIMMPDGRMADTDRMMTEAMIKDAKPMDGCVILMRGADGKMYMSNDMKMADGKSACETVMTMENKKKK